METKETANLLRNLAQQYNTKDFIQNDPVQFPHRYTDKRDIEISAIISSWIAYGNRKQIILTLNRLHTEFYDSPYCYIRNRRYVAHRHNEQCLYRFYIYKDFYQLCETLYCIYISKQYPSMEDKLLSIQKEYTSCISLLEALISLFPNQKGIPLNTTSACKRLCLLLRWLIRKDSIVDLGIWNLLPQSELLIPLDTHVFRMAKELNLTNRKQADMKTAVEISNKLKKVFPDDPTLGDFALFGYGIDHK